VAVDRLVKEPDVSESVRCVHRRLNELLPPRIFKKLTMASDNHTNETESVLQHTRHISCSDGYYNNTLSAPILIFIGLFLK